MRKKIEKALAKRADTFHHASDAIWDYAELGFTEHRSAALLEDLLEKEGFTVTRGVCGIPTAFIAETVIGEGGPTIGFLAEFDSLPALSQKAGVPFPDPLVPGAPGHGCGHNTSGAMQALTVCSLKEALGEAGIPATLKYFGTPAEELASGKTYLARDGVFNGVDVMFDCHGAGAFSVSHGTENTACFSMVATFRGKTAHAGGRPWEGRSAADAMELMHAGTERLREHMLPEQRIHWATLGVPGAAPNVVPDLARTWYLVRSTDDLVQALYDRVEACAHGAAMMTGTTVTIEMIAACHQRYSNKALAEAFYANIRNVGAPQYTAQEHEFIRTLQKSIGAPEKGMDLDVFIEDSATVPAKGGSSDVGDVTLNAPCATLRYPVWAPGAQSHTWGVTACTKTSIAHKGIDAAALVSCLTAVDILTKPEILHAIRKEFEELSAKRPFASFIPKGATPPFDWHEETMAKYR